MREDAPSEATTAGYHMLHPDTELRWIDSTVGFGVVATRAIARGTITWARDPLDATLTPAARAALDALYGAFFERYAFIDGRGDTVLCWDHTRFVNHGCDPASLDTGFDCDVAVRDIAAGEQLTVDYGQLALAEPMTCACGAAACRQVIRPDDPARLADDWRARSEAALVLARAVPQPLARFFRELPGRGS